MVGGLVRSSDHLLDRVVKSSMKANMIYTKSWKSYNMACWKMAQAFEAKGHDVISESALGSGEGSFVIFLAGYKLDCNLKSYP